MSHEPTARSPHVRTSRMVVGAVVGAFVGGALTALVVAASPAQAGPITIPVNCSDKVVLDDDDTSYELSGTCGVVVVTGDRIQVSMPAAQRLVIRGADNVVESKTIDTVVMRGHDHRVSLPSARVLRLASPGSRVVAEGLVEDVELGRKRGTLSADQISDLRIAGRGHVVTARRGFDARIPGNRNDVDFRRLQHVVLTGDHNAVTVTRGTTKVRDSGSGNRVRINRRG